MTDKTVKQCELPSRIETVCWIFAWGISLTLTWTTAGALSVIMAILSVFCAFKGGGCLTRIYERLEACKGEQQ